jgi:hypothetical protein
MTNPNDISAVLLSISEAKRALDAEPQYRRHIHELEQKLIIDGQTIASREQRIHELKQSEEALQAKLRSVEAERDEAGFRALEESDKVSALSTLVRSYVGDCLKTLAAVEGKAPPLLIAKDEYDSLIQANKDLDKRISEVEYERDSARANDELAQAALKAAREQLERKPDPSPLGVTIDTPHSEPTASSLGETTSSGSGESATDPTPAETYGAPAHGSVTSQDAVPSNEVQSAIPPSQPATTTTSSDITTVSGGTGQGQTGEPVKQTDKEWWEEVVRQS